MWVCVCECVAGGAFRARFVWVGGGELGVGVIQLFLGGGGGGGFVVWWTMEAVVVVGFFLFCSTCCSCCCLFVDKKYKHKNIYIEAKMRLCVLTYMLHPHLPRCERFADCSLLFVFLLLLSSCHCS